jgi:prepilin-type N-terminal cleavage/methylation domain-containing protein
MTRRLHGAHGYSLVEMLIVMALMGIVIGGLTTVFVSGSGASNTLNQEFQAQQTARLALDRLRTDVHCAAQASASTINGFQGVKLDVANCSAATPTVTWCILASTALTGRYALWRTTLNSTATCTASDTMKVLQADYLMPVGSPASTANIISTPSAAYQGLETVGIDLKVAVTLKANTSYELKDSLVTRNWTRCQVAAGCAPSVS